jgi:hypothetical protein
MVLGSVLLHTMIGLFMGLVTFGLLMMALVLSFVPPEAVHRLFARRSSAFSVDGEQAPGRQAA